MGRDGGARGVEGPPARDLDWAGMYNVRDLGGLPTRTGARTRAGAFVRSEGLDRLAPDGWAALHRHGVRTCVDLRSGFEVRDRPYAPVAGVERAWAPLEDGLLDDPTFRGWAEDGLLATALYYRPFLDRWPDRVAAVVRALATAEPGGVLYHCQRGRDRTGLVTVVLLLLAGVPDEVIVEDHVRTDERLRRFGTALGHEGIDGEPERYAALGSSLEVTLDALLRDLDVDDYLRQAGVPAAELDRLRHRLVEGRTP